MQDSRPRHERNGRQCGVFSSHDDRTQTLAPEVRAARMLLTPSAQEDIAHLAEDIEISLSGNQPNRVANSRPARRGIALWIAVSMGGLIVLALAGSSGWVSALRFNSIADKNKLIADQKQQLATYYENQAEAERKLREDLQARDEQIKYIVTTQLEIIADFNKNGKYSKALTRIDQYTEIIEALGEQGGDLSKRIKQQRVETLLAVIASIHSNEADLSGVRAELEKLSNIKSSSLNSE